MGSTTLFNPVFVNPERVNIFYRVGCSIFTTIMIYLLNTLSLLGEEQISHMASFKSTFRGEVEVFYNRRSNVNDYGLE